MNSIERSFNPQNRRGTIVGLLVSIALASASCSKAPAPAKPPAAPAAPAPAAPAAPSSGASAKPAAPGQASAAAVPAESATPADAAKPVIPTTSVGATPPAAAGAPGTATPPAAKVDSRPWREDWPNGTPKARCTLVRDPRTNKYVMHGLWQSWNQDGSLNKEGHYVYGEQDGDWKFYYPGVDRPIVESFKLGKKLPPPR